jgi:outer membrane protein assembly factor BamB
MKIPFVATWAALATVLLAALVPVATAAESFMKGRRFAATDYSGNKIAIVEANGKISWKLAAKSTNDLWILPGGTLLFGNGHGVKEVSFKDNSVKFEYTSKSEIYAVQRLANGNTFVGECSSGKLLEVAPDGKTIVKEISTLAKQITPKRPLPGGHTYMRNCRVLPNGNYLVTLYHAGEAAEFNPAGEKVWSVKAPGGARTVVRLANGNTLVSAGDTQVRNGIPTALYEFDPAGKEIWKVTNDDLPGKPLYFAAGLQVLPNGNILLCNWLGRGNFGKAPHILEITRDKKVVWTYADHKQFKTITNVHVFGEGDAPLSGAGFH